MPVISSQAFVDSHTQRDGRRFIRFEWTVTGGEVLTHFGYGKYRVNDGPGTQAEEVEAIRANLETKLNRQLEFREAYETLQDWRKAQNLQHTTRARVAELIFRAILRERYDLDLIRKAKPIVDYIKANFTVAQIRNATGLTNEQLTKIENRINAVVGERTFTGMAPEEIEAQIQSDFESYRERGIAREK